MRLILAPTLTQGAEPQFPPLCTHPRSEGASSISRGDGLRGQRSPDWPSASPFHSGPPCWGQAKGQGQGPCLESLFSTPPRSIPAAPDRRRPGTKPQVASALPGLFPTGILGRSVARSPTGKDWEAGCRDLPKQKGKAPASHQGAP